MASPRTSPKRAGTGRKKPAFTPEERERMAAILAEDRQIKDSVIWWAESLRVLYRMLEVSARIQGEATYGILKGRTDPEVWERFGNQLTDLTGTLLAAQIRYGSSANGDPLENPFEEVARS